MHTVERSRDKTLMSEAAVSKEETQESGEATKPSPQPLRFLIAASGTGGHLIPAVHIADAIKSAHPHCEIEFIGAGRPLEETLIVARGFKRHIVAASGIKRRGVLGVLSFIAKLPVATSQLLRLYRSFSPSVVIGVGGYVSVLPVVVARLKGIPTWTHEAELHPGLANRVLARVADCMSVAFDETRIRGRARLQVTGHPVRQELRAIDRVLVREGAPKHLLILGGSQGARGLDSAVTEIAPMLAERGISVVHQARPEEAETVAAAYRAAKVSAHVVSFIDDMPGAYEWADIIVSRAVTTLPEFIRDTRLLVTKGKGRMLYLKGGDLEAEIGPVREKVHVHALSDYFTEEFFATKRVVEMAM